MYDSTADTLTHIGRVQVHIAHAQANLDERAALHDLSKLQEPEKSIFDEYTPKLKTSTYGSEEYKQFLTEMGVALQHHYAHNSHHPEHWPIPASETIDQLRADIAEFESISEDLTIISPDPLVFVRVGERLKMLLAWEESRINGMSLLDLMEMGCDWFAATERHADGDIVKSLEINSGRFGMTNQVKSILYNTFRELGFIKKV